MKINSKFLGLAATGCVFAAVAGFFVAAPFFGQRVEVPPAHIGKILTKNGYAPESIPPSRFRLDACFWYCDRLVLIEASDTGVKETFKLFMPREQLNMSFDVRFTLAVRNDAQALDSIFDRVTSKRGVITISRIYDIYGQPIMREIVRTAMAKYTINEVASSRERINTELREVVTNALAGTPLSIKRFSLADVQFPEVITKQKEIAAQRRVEIEEQEAKKQIALVQLQTELEKAKLNRKVRREKAEAAREENAIYAESVSDKYLQYRRLEVLEKMAINPNTVFVPFDALGTVGMQQRIFTKEVRK